MAILQLPDNTTVIGRLPGYNPNIDGQGEFQNELLKGVTFVDLRPTSYTFGDALSQHSLPQLWTDIKKALNSNGLFKEENTGLANDLFYKILKRMQKDFKLPESFSTTQMIRIIAANESTFNEVFSNNFSGNNHLFSKLSNWTKSLSETAAGQLLKGAKGFSHAGVIQELGKAYEFIGEKTKGKGSSIIDVLGGAIWGMEMAIPSVWENSSYTSTFSLMIKLVSPSGEPECIRKNILEPLLYLLAASSPITYGGIMSGYPLLWNVHAHGITNFRLGTIAAMTITRGSFETTFTSLLQPTVIDVRLTIVPIMNEFAVQVYTNHKSIYTTPEEFGVQNPADIERGVTNKPTGILSDQKTEIISIKL